MEYRSFYDYLKQTDLDNGKLRIDADIEPTNVSDWISSIQIMDGIPAVKSITVEINSPGGEVYSALALHDAIKGCKKHVTVLCVGLAASAAAMIVLQAGHRRAMTINSTLILHEVRQWADGNVPLGDAEDNIAESRRLQEVVYSIMERSTGKSREELEELVSRKTVYLDAPGALEYGLVDEIE